MAYFCVNKTKNKIYEKNLLEDKNIISGISCFSSWFFICSSWCWWVKKCCFGILCRLTKPPSKDWWNLAQFEFLVHIWEGVEFLLISQFQVTWKQGKNYVFVLTKMNNFCLYTWLEHLVNWLSVARYLLIIEDVLMRVFQCTTHSSQYNARQSYQLADTHTIEHWPL